MPPPEDEDKRAAINALILHSAKNQGDLAMSTTKLLAKMGPMDMKRMLQELIDKLTDKELARELLRTMTDHVKNHPYRTAFIVGGILLMCNPLALAGFGALGPVAGSIAAGWQASVGASVTAGSTFAVLQSWGMLYAVTIPTVGAAIAGGAVTYGVVAPHIGNTWTVLNACGNEVEKWGKGDYGQPVKEWMGGKYGNPVSQWWKGEFGNPVRDWMRHRIEEKEEKDHEHEE